MKPWFTGKPTLLLSTLAVTTVFVLAVAGDEQQTRKPEKTPQSPTQAVKAKPMAANPAVRTTPASPATVGGPKTYTNDDLKRLFGEAPSEAAATASPGSAETARSAAAPEAPAKGALEQLEEQQKLQAEKREKIAEAEKALAAAEQRAADVERRGLAVRNPYLKRPNVSEEEHKDWDKLGAAERAKRTDEDLRKAREEVETARQALEELRRTP